MLYRKYRPQTFAQLVGQEHVVKTLKGGLSSGRIGHAYLFTGPRGTGKTTMARIFAKALNCSKRGKDGDPCGACDNCQGVERGNSLDLIEIDAASNRGIDEIRNLKESAFVAAPGGGYKVFLIDEVHMLTKDAFNALLKILEEPPKHVIFVLATTEPHKILATVLSRVQRFDFKRLTPGEIVTKLKDITKAEKMQIEDESLFAIATASDGALRDAEVALTKIRSQSEGKVTLDEVNKMLGLIPYTYHPELLGYICDKNASAAVQLIHNIHQNGIDLEHFAKEFLEYSRRVLMSRINPATLAAVDGQGAEKNYVQFQHLDGKTLVRVIQAFTQARGQVKFSPIPQLPLELAVLELTQ